jgi:hypothetical protein
MRNLPFYVLATLTVVLLVFLATRLVGDGQSPQLPPEAQAGSGGDVTIEDIQALDGLPAYWLGDSYEGLPLINVQHMWDPGSPDGVLRPEERVTLIYASCKPGHPAGGGSAEGYCAEGEEPTYVSVTSEWLCLRPPSLLVQGARNGPPVEVRGAQVQKTTSGNTRFYFGNSTVTIFASEGEDVTIEAFDHLVAANPPALASAPEAGSPLASPVSEEACSSFVLPTPVPTLTPLLGPTTTPDAAAETSHTAESLQ